MSVAFREIANTKTLRRITALFMLTEINFYAYQRSTVLAWLRSGTILVRRENSAEEFTISVGKIEQK